MLLWDRIFWIGLKSAGGTIFTNTGEAVEGGQFSKEIGFESSPSFQTMSRLISWIDFHSSYTSEYSL